MRRLYLLTSRHMCQNFSETIKENSFIAALREKCPNTEFFLVHNFPHSNWIRRDTPYLSVFSPNAGKYRPGKTPYLDTSPSVCFLNLLPDFNKKETHKHDFGSKIVIYFSKFKRNEQYEASQKFGLTKSTISTWRKSLWKVSWCFSKSIFTKFCAPQNLKLRMP